MKNQLNEDEENDNSDILLEKPYSDFENDESMIDDNSKLFQQSRSKTMSSSALIGKKSKDSKLINSSSSPNVNTDRLKMAREEAEKAIKVKLLHLFYIKKIKYLKSKKKYLL